MRYILFIFISLFILSCKNGEKATYHKDPEFKKLNEKDFLEAASIDSSINTNRMDANFSYKKYYNLLNLKISNRELSVNKKLNLARTLSFHCSEQSIDIQLNSFKTLLNVSKNPSFNLTILNYEKEFLNRCEYITDRSLLEIKHIHSFVLDLPKESIMPLLENIIDIDKLVSQKSVLAQSYSSYNAAELNKLFLLLSNTSSISEITQLINLHKKISPLSKINRIEILEKTFEGANGLRIIENSELETISEFLHVYLNEKNEYNQARLKAAINILISKIQNKYANITRFEDIKEILASAWEDYTKIFQLLKTDKIKNKKFIIQSFGKLNLIIEKIYQLPLNRTPAKNFLENINGETGQLALFHLLRLSNVEDRALLVDGDNQTHREISINSTLDTLLDLRIKIHQTNGSTAIKNYCAFLNNIQFGNKNYKKVKKVNSIVNNQNLFGCYELTSFEHLLTKKQKAQDEKYQLSLKIDNVESSVDLLIKLNDVDLTITSDYYNGPLWYLATARKRGKRTNPVVDLNAKASVLALDVNLSNNDKRYFPIDTLRLFYNYDVTKASVPKSQETYLGDKPLKQGFRGGNLTISVKSTKSIRPIAISEGSNGEEGPDDIYPGLGIKSQEIQTILFMGENSEFYGNAIYAFNGVTFPNLDLLTLKKLKNYAFDVVINKELTDQIHSDLCSENQKKSPNDICYISGDTSEYKKLTNNEYNYLNQVADNALKHAVSLLANEHTTVNYISEKFNFPPNLDDARGVTTMFDNGPHGTKGKIKFKLRN